MGKINVLDFEIANLIAAGEVVERPSSVVKELIENSIDSGATSIVAEIKRGGVALIRVSDNGCGMSREDLPVSIKRHATSKIRNRDDLDMISTLGFRGEALAAISSVSNVTIITKTKDSSEGSMLVSEGGNIVDISEVGSADGTTVVVENLFYNVPARRKFLKKDSTEAMNVSALMEKVALSRPDISIQLLVDGEERFKTPGDGNLLNAIYAVFGKEFSSKLIEATGTANGVKVHGYIGRSDNVRKNRNLENVFINGRYVKCLTAMAAIEKAYTSYIAPEAFPVCVLFIEINPALVDVNVHPAKLEVKFANEQPIFETVYYTIKRAIEDHVYRPEINLTKKSERNPIGAFVPIGQNTKGEQISILNTPAYVKPAEQRPSVTTEKNPAVTSDTVIANPAKSVTSDTPVRVASGAGESFGREEKKAEYKKSYDTPRSDFGVMTPTDSVSLLEKYSKARADLSYTPKMSVEQTHESKPEIKIEEKCPIEYKIIGEAFDCYVLVEYEGALLVIDKHAAHERVIFEELKAISQGDGRVASQSLILPLTVKLAPDECAAAGEYEKELNSVGFEFILGDGYADVSAIPDAISSADAEALFVKMIDEISEGRGNPEISEKIRREKALYQIACKAAIKGGRKYDRAIIEWLVTKLLSLPDVTVCPHGRPVAYKLTKTELDRQFDRIK
jgi:DNA mismatch repair protein MutL